MGAWLKLGTIAIVLAMSYVFTSMILVSASALVGYLGLTQRIQTPYFPLAGDLLWLVSVVTVSAFFTLPGVLAAFGHGGAWVKHVVARFGKGLLAAFGTSFLFYIGAAAASSIEIEASFASIGAALPVLGLVGLLALAVLSRDALLKLAEVVLGFSFSLAARVSQRVRKQSTAAVELQLTTIKPIRGRSDERILQEEALKFQRFGRALAAAGGTAEFRLSFRGRRGRILLLTKGTGSQQSLEQRLGAVVRTYLPESKPSPTRISKENTPSATILLSGVPEAAPNPLEPVARFFIENGFEGDYAAVFRGHRNNPVTRLITRRAQRKLARDSAEQKSAESLVGDQNTTTEQDYFVGTEAEAAAKRVERQTSPQSIESWIYVSARGKSRDEAERLAESAAITVRASLSSHREKEELKMRKQKRAFEDLLPRGEPSVIIPSEAAPLVWVPQMAIGTEVAPSVEFELPPALEGEIDLGEVVLQSGKSGHNARIPLDDLTKHAFLTGMTGSGKTTSAFNLLIQLHEHGVPFLVIEPVKTEYRSLALTIQGLQVFTPGEEKVAPFRLNIFEPPLGVSVAKHLEVLEASWNGSFVMYAPLPYVVKQVLVETYASCGWDVKKDVKGRPITLEDFRLNAERVVEKLGYAHDETANIGAALKVRITNLALGDKGAVFNASASTPLEAILRRPTVIELKGIPNGEEKAFVASLLLSNLAEYLEAKGASKGLKHVTLVEEAHRLLPNVSTAKGDPEAADPRKTMVEQFANMLAEVRAYGEGLVIVEQIPTKILPDAIKNTATKVAHRVPAKDDRDVLAGAMGMTDEQSEVLTALKPGEAVVHLQGHPLPIRVVARNRIKEFGIPVGEVDDDYVRKLMGGFYLKNPVPREPGWVLEKALRAEIDTEAFRTRFKAAYEETIRKRSPEPVVKIATEVAKTQARDDIECYLITIKVLQMATAFHLPFDDEDRERFPREVLAYMGRKERDARRG
jgi:Helicase HerA, central domain